MRAVVQRVKEAKVEIAGKTVGQIGQGLLTLVGVAEDDTEKDSYFMSDKVANLRIFADTNGQMNRSVLDIKGEVLVVSQFTLLGDCRKGRRPSFAKAARPGLARTLYEVFVQALEEKGLHVETGRFQEMMDVYLVNDGPVTILLDSHKLF